VRKAHLDSEAGRKVFKHVQAKSREVNRSIHDVALRYTLERFLYRLFETPAEKASGLFLSPVSEVFLNQDTITVKGGLTMIFAEGVAPFEGRTTGDADLHLAAFPGSMEDYAAILRHGLAGTPATGPDDGIRFDVDAIRVSSDRDERTGGTLVVPLQIGALTLQVKTDVTFDNRPMHDRAPVVEYPSVIPEAGLPPPRIRRVPFEFMLADKFSAAVEYGLANKRLRDYPDMLLLLREVELDPDFLAETIAATLRFRGIPLPASMDAAAGFSDRYAVEKGARWEIEKVSRNYRITIPLTEMLSELRDRLAPVLERAHRAAPLPEWADGSTPRG
jgi:hypothetical protein